jgi:DNA-binding transcriptional ArsR family regulator
MSAAPQLLEDHAFPRGVAEQLDLAVGALASASRRAILSRLKLGQATVGELATASSLSPAAVSRHIRVLEEAGLVSRTRLHTMHLIHLERGPLLEVMAWLSTLAWWPLDGLALEPGPPIRAVRAVP